MKFASDWKSTLKKAWSVRLLLVAGLLTGAEVILPHLTSALPGKAFAILSFLVVFAAFVARLLAQKSMDDK